MRKLVVTELLTLDAVMQAPGDVNEDRSGGFEHGGWQMPYVDDVQLSAASEGIAQTESYLLGRRTYEIIAAYWPHQPDSYAFLATLNGLTRFVVSNTLREPLERQNSVLIGGDVPTAMAERADAAS